MEGEAHLLSNPRQRTMGNEGILKVLQMIIPRQGRSSSISFPMVSTEIIYIKGTSNEPNELIMDIYLERAIYKTRSHGVIRVQGVTWKEWEGGK